jgi:hypothetical protein
MLPKPMTLLEAALWESHARLDEARAIGYGITPADDAARALVATYLTAGPEHVSALRAFLQRLDGELSLLEGERERILGAIEIAEGDRRRYRAHVLNAMRDANLERARGLTGLISVGRARPRLEVRDAAAIPDEFAKVLPPRRELRVQEAERAIAAGGFVPGVITVTGDPMLVIR